MNKHLLVVATCLLGVLANPLPAEAAGKLPVAIANAANAIHHRDFPQRIDLPADARKAIPRYRVRSVPYWSFSFDYAGTTYTEQAVGKSIFQPGGNSVVNVPIIPVRFRFVGYVDPATGLPPVIDATPDIPDVLHSPNFVSSQYSTGFTQYQDAAQRASFYGYYGDNWHTLLVPHALATVTIDVPEDQGVLYVLDDGTLFAAIEAHWFSYQQVQAMYARNINTEQLPILLTHNVGVYEDDPANCCSLAWHGAYLDRMIGGTEFIQTHIWGGWFTAEVTGEAFADAYGLSHEIAEWMNDPFSSNFVPKWDFPQGPHFYYQDGACQYPLQFNLMEVADPLESSDYSHEVTLGGYRYHLAEQALASWFAREAPSSALHGAYSFPDETALTGPSLPCPY